MSISLSTISNVLGFGVGLVCAVVFEDCTGLVGVVVLGDCTGLVCISALGLVQVWFLLVLSGRFGSLFVVLAF